MAKYDALFGPTAPEPTGSKYDDLFKLPDYSPAPEDQAGPVTPKTMADTHAALQSEANGDIDVTGTPASPAYRNQQDLAAGAPLSSLHGAPADEARDFLQFAGAGAAGELAAPLIARGVGSVADRARAIQAARAGREVTQPIVSDPAALAPVEMGPSLRPRRPDFWVPQEGDHGADLFETPSTAERTANIRLPGAGRLNAEGTKGAAPIVAANLERLKMAPPQEAADGSSMPWRESPFPYRRKPWIESSAPQVRQEVPIDKLFGSQKEVSEEGILKNYARDPAAMADGDLPLVYAEPNGTYTIGDGHHRLVSSYLRGEKTAPARVVTIPPSGRLNAEGTKGGAVEAAAKMEGEAADPFTGQMDYAPVLTPPEIAAHGLQIHEWQPFSDDVVFQKWKATPEFKGVGLRSKTDPSQFVAIHRSTKEAGKWQGSLFDDRGAVGDMQRTDPNEILREYGPKNWEPVARDSPISWWTRNSPLKPPPETP